MFTLKSITLKDVETRLIEDEQFRQQVVEDLSILVGASTIAEILSTNDMKELAITLCATQQLVGHLSEAFNKE